MANVDIAGNTLVVTDVQVGATTGGIGATGSSVSTFMAGAGTSATSLPGNINVLNATVSASGSVTSLTPAIILGSATSGPGVYFGLGTSPGFTAHTGSLYINTQSSTLAATTALYVNTTGVSTWVAVL